MKPTTTTPSPASVQEIMNQSTPLVVDVTDELEIAALRHVRSHFGVKAAEVLRYVWATGEYDLGGLGEHEQALRELRARLGLDWLLHVDLEEYADTYVLPSTEPMTATAAAELADELYAHVDQPFAEYIQFVSVRGETVRISLAAIREYGACLLTRNWATMPHDVLRASYTQEALEEKAHYSSEGFYGVEYYAIQQHVIRDVLAQG